MKTKLAFIITFFLCFTIGAYAQDTLSGDYKKLHIGAGRYIVKDMLTVSDSLLVDAGAILVLSQGATIVSNGYLSMKGVAGKRIVVMGLPKETGNGIAINGSSEERVAFDFVSFRNLVMPVNFLSGWARKKVDIQHCEFINNEGTSAILQVLNPSFGINDNSSVVGFTIRNSLFTGNKASIYFEDLNNPHLAIDISSNTFSGNRIQGYGKYSFSGNMIFGRMDKSDKPFRTLFQNNSMQQNFLWDLDADTILNKANFGIYGTADSLLVANNYWGDDKEAGVRKGLYDFALNYTSPRLQISPFLQIPSDSTPAHFFQFMSEGKLLPYDYSLSGGLSSVQLIANKKVRTEKMQLHYTYLVDSVLHTKDTAINFTQITTDPAKPMLRITADSFFRKHTGYLRISGVYADGDETVPDVLIGYQDYKSVYSGKKNNLAKMRMGSMPDSVMIKPKLVNPVLTPFKKRYEIGIVGAYAIYYGTLANKKLFSNDFNSMLGIQFRYSLQSHVSFSLTLSKGTLTGSDLRSQDSSKIARGLSFKTPIMTVSAQLEFDLVNNRLFSTRNRIRPSIGFGVDYIKFNPTGEYLGKSYNLQPLGTGGQTLNDSGAVKYPLSTFGAPISAQVRYCINKRTIFSVFATYHLSFSDFIDDVGSTPYPDKLKLAAANPGNEAAAQYLSNPTNRVVTKGMTRSGAASRNDSFVMFGISLAHHF